MTSAPTFSLDAGAAPRPLSIFRFRRTPGAKARHKGGNGLNAIAALFLFLTNGDGDAQAGKPALFDSNQSTAAPRSWTLAGAAQFFNVGTSSASMADPPPQKERLPKRDY